MAKRRFTICFDGTWNDPDQGGKPTNVVKIVRSIRRMDDAGITQVSFYDKGVGTSGGTDKLKGGAFGAGLTANVLDGYRFLANNYEAGDEIYLFGFSRGAYTARSLAGLIGLAGLLDTRDLGAGLHQVMAIYRQKDLDRTGKQRAIAALSLFGTRRSPVRIRCVGVWDTVGSLGIPGDLGRQFFGGKYYFHDVQLGGHVDIALHAVAIDEKRAAFSPTLWVSRSGRPETEGQRVEQVWFAGAHSNVGGSYDDSGLSDIAFDWMVKRVDALTDLAFDEGYVAVESRPNVAGKGIDSRTFLYTGSRVYPYQRLINREVPKGRGVGEWVRTTFPDFDRRNIPPDGLIPVNEALHVSTLERWRQDAVPHDCGEGGSCRPVPYRPVNLAAVLTARKAARVIPVVGWNGEIMDPTAVPWPAGS